MVYWERKGATVLERGWYVLLMLLVLDWVVAFGSEDEVSWDQLRTLVQQLVEGVLGVSGRLAEEDGSGSVLDVFSTAGDTLAVRLHG